MASSSSRAAGSTPGRHRSKRRTHDKYSHTRDDGDGGHSADSENVTRLSLDELRTVRTRFYSQSPEERRRSQKPTKSTSTGPVDGRHSSSRRSSRDASSPTGMESRREHRLSHGRRKRRSSHRQPDDERDSSVYVYASGPASSSGRERAHERREKSHRRTRERSGKRTSSSRSPVRRKSSHRREHDNDLRSSYSRRSSTPSQALVDASDKLDVIVEERALPVVLEEDEDMPDNEEDQERFKASRKSEEPAPSTGRPSLTRSRTTTSARVSAWMSPFARSPTKPLEKETASIAPSTTSSRRTRAAKPDPMVECLTCASEVRSSKAAHLRCGHIMCDDCLIRLFNLSITDPQHMPPKCCTSDHIPLSHVDKLFGDGFKRIWNKKYQEYTTQNRIYCPAKGCGEWIKPKYYGTDKASGRKYAKCKYCSTKVCVKCNAKWHHQAECPNDPANKEFVDMAKKAGWQKCYNCKAMVELKEGCNHMTCRCTAEFCMICGLKWKTCDCPWFNYEQMPQLGAGAHPFEGFDFHRFFRGFPRAFVPPEPVRNGANPAEPPDAAPQGYNLPQAHGYQQELEARRRQEQMDEEFARRLQLGDMEAHIPNLHLNHMHARFAHLAGVHAAQNFEPRDLAREAIHAAFGAGQQMLRDLFDPGERERRNQRSTRGFARDSGRHVRRRVSDHGPRDAEPSQNEDVGLDSPHVHPHLRNLSPTDVHRYGVLHGSGARRASDMAGLGRPGARGQARVGGWLAHVENASDDENHDRDE